MSDMGKIKEPCNYCRKENPDCLVGGKEFADDEFAEIEDGEIYIESWLNTFT